MKKLVRFLRILCVLGALAAAVCVTVGLSLLQQSQYRQPGLADDRLNILLPAMGIGCMLLLLPFVQWGLGYRFGFRLLLLKLGFLHLSGKDGLKVRPGRFGYGVLLLPPRTDGMSPILPVLSAPLCMLCFGGLFALLTWIFWATSAAQSLMLLSLMCIAFCLARLLPRQDGTDELSMFLSMRRDPALRRAWECGHYINEALAEKTPLSDMPDEWFLTAPPASAEHPVMATLVINTSSRMMRQSRFVQAHAMVTPLLALASKVSSAPSANTYQVLSCAILNGAICEPLADLPPQCLNQLDHPSVQYMTPPTWEPRRLTAQYAYDLFVAQDENAAAQTLGKLKAADQQELQLPMIQALQEKFAALHPIT